MSVGDRHRKRLELPRAQTKAETFDATASVTTSTGTKTAPVTVVITRQTTEQERAKVADALRDGRDACGGGAAEDDG